MPDPTALDKEASVATARLTTREIVQRLNAEIGPIGVAALAGMKDSKASYRWQQAGGTKPGRRPEARLRLAYRAWLIVSKAEGNVSARGWFMTSNPRLGEVAPVEAVAQDRSRDVVNAALAQADAETLNA